MLGRGRQGLRKSGNVLIQNVEVPGGIKKERINLSIELKINPEFHKLIPPISPEEYQLLEESILEEGCRDAIIIWDDSIIEK